MIPLNWTDLESSSIRKVKFEPNKHDMRGDVLVEFNEGKVWRYRDVPAHKVEHMVHSSSPSASFHNHIKPYHDCEAE